MKATGESALTAEEEKLLDELETELEPDAGADGIAVPEEEPLLDDAELPENRKCGGTHGFVCLESRDDELPELEEDLEPAPRAACQGGWTGSRPRQAFGSRGHSLRSRERITSTILLPWKASLPPLPRRPATPPLPPPRSSRGSRTSCGPSASDLNQLRHDLSGLRKTAAEGGGEGPSAQAGSQSGFFDEDEDEAIALTGDELDNILNTAEITEETAEAPGAGVDMDLMGGMEALESGDVLSFDTPAAEAVEMPASSDDLELVEEAEPEDDTLVLTDDDLLPTAGVHRRNLGRAGRRPPCRPRSGRTDIR